MSALLRCFGGPNDGEMLPANETSTVIEVPQMPPLMQWSVDERFDVMSPIIETVRYDVHRFWFHDDHPARCRCPYDPYRGCRVPGPDPASCVQEYRCLVRLGYDEQRVVDAMRALAAITFALTSRGTTSNG